MQASFEYLVDAKSGRDFYERALERLRDIVDYKCF